MTSNLGICMKYYYPLFEIEKMWDKTKLSRLSFYLNTIQELGTSGVMKNQLRDVVKRMEKGEGEEKDRNEVNKSDRKA